MMNFEQLLPHYQEMMDNSGFTQLTEIQRQVIPSLMKSKDIIAVSKTVTGKTHAFLFPIFERITVDYPKVQAVITAPTRELAMQIYQFATKLREVFPEVTVDLITGGGDRKKAVAKLNTQPHIVIGTPGRLKDMFLEQRALRLDTATIFVVDEADMTMEYGFLDDIDMMVSKMDKKLQMVVLSATLPQALQPFFKKYLVRPQMIQVSEDAVFKPRVKHVLIPTKHKDYQQTLLSILPAFTPYVCLIFANTRDEASLTAQFLRDEGYDIIELHGDLTPRQRKSALLQLQRKESSYVVATDIASRGLDVAEVTHVVSLGFPSDLSFYTHRSGRTGRAGKEGICYTIYSPKDEVSIHQLIKEGMSFEHQTIRQGAFASLKPFGYKRPKKPSELDVEIKKIVANKKVKVKPGYKKKMAAEVDKLKRKKRRAMIQGEIAIAKKERAKAKQKEKRSD
ncbi:MAG TPA: DEAD/DEAH box helicase [Erysipelotrichaceae bacterium]|nr:DEAD/DEAH box helicase [Erysipelotrichaceae bacterium]